MQLDPKILMTIKDLPLLAKTVIDGFMSGYNKSSIKGPGLEFSQYRSYQPGDELEVDFHFACWLTPQQYTLTVATQGPDGSSHDWLDDVIPFDVVDTRMAAGVANLRAEIAWRASR